MDLIRNLTVSLARTMHPKVIGHKDLTKIPNLFLDSILLNFALIDALAIFRASVSTVHQRLTDYLRHNRLPDTMEKSFASIYDGLIPIMNYAQMLLKQGHSPMETAALVDSVISMYLNSNFPRSGSKFLTLIGVMKEETKKYLLQLSRTYGSRSSWMVVNDIHIFNRDKDTEINKPMRRWTDYEYLDDYYIMSLLNPESVDLERNLYTDTRSVNGIITALWPDDDLKSQSALLKSSHADTKFAGYYRKALATDESVNNGLFSPIVDFVVDLISMAAVGAVASSYILTSSKHVTRMIKMQTNIGLPHKLTEAILVEPFKLK